MDKYIALLRQLIATPSYSREENLTADLLTAFLAGEGMEEVRRAHNNVWVYNRYFDPAKPTILLNSHHDTVSPTALIPAILSVPTSRTVNYTVSAATMPAPASYP